MNKSYRLIYNEITNTWVAVSETAKTRGKRAAGAVLLATASVVLCIPPVTSYAAPPNPPAPTQLPTGGQVVAGQAGIVQNAATLNVNQSSNRAVIDWASFNVGSQARVNFNQPGISSVTLNRVLDANPSQIFGKISAPGQVFLTNPNGVYFAPGASVDVGALVATTHSISNEDFMAGGNSFTRNGASGSVVNDGNITTSLGGYVALLAPEVRNSGVIVAQLGTVALAAGEVFELQFDGNNTLANIRVTPASIAALIDNGNAVHAPGGLIILSAQALNHLQGGVVNNSGSLEASGLTANGGVIRLEASDRIRHNGIIQVDAAPNSSGKGGTVSLIADLANAGSTTQIDGSISARAGHLGGDGGFVETSGTRLKIGDTTRVDTSAPQGKTGTWLLDPTDYTIAASGGDISGTTLSGNLGTSDVTIQSTEGNINVSDTVSWSADKTLTLNAYNNININSSITASGALGKLALLYGQGTSTGVISGNTATYNINAPVNLHAGLNFRTKLGSDGVPKYYQVITSLGAEGSTTATDLQGINGGLSGNYALGGNIDASATSSWNGSGSPAVYAGFLPIGGDTNFTGTFDGLGHTISNLTINRPSTNYVGLFAKVSSATISNLGLVDGSVTGGYFVGSLMGVGLNSTVRSSYATGPVTGSGDVGGLAGQSYISSISNSYATGAVTGAIESIYVGGLVGQNYASFISNSYATGLVTAGSGSILVGGLVGSNDSDSVITHSFYDSTVNYALTGLGNAADSVGSVQGMSTTDLKLQANFTSATVANGSVNPGWDFSTTSVWKVAAGKNGGYPYRAWSEAYVSSNTTIYVDLITGSSVYGSTPSFGWSYFTNPDGTGPTTVNGVGGSIAWSGAPSVPTSTSGVGTYNLSYAGSLALSNYTFIAGPAVPWYVTARPITVTASSTGKTYGAADPALIYTEGGLGRVNGDTFTGGLSRSGGNGVGNYAINQGSLDLGGNYSLSYNGATFSISPAPLTVTGNSASVTYNGKSQSASGFSASGLVNGDSASVLSAVSASGTGTNAGSYAVVPTGTAANYTLSFVNGNLVIAKAAATVTGNSANKTYNGVSQSASGFTATGLVNGETASVLTGVSASGSGTNAGSYAVVPTGTAANYTLSFVNGNLVIAKAAATVTGNSANKTYNGVSQSASGFTATGLVNGETVGVLTGVSASGTGTNAGSYAVVPTGTDANYTLSFVNGNLVIAKAAATVTGNSANKTYNGVSQSASGFTATGLVNGETASVLTGVSASGSGTNAGSYAVVPTGTAANYTLSFVNGNLVIAKAAATVTGNSANKTYNGVSQSASGFTATGLVNGETVGVLTGVSASGTGTDAGSYAVVPTGTDANYTLSFVNGHLTVVPAPLTVTANNAAKTYDGLAYQGGNGLVVSGFVNGEGNSLVSGTPVYTGNAQGATNAGAYTISVAGLTAGNNYTLSFVDGQLLISKAHLTVTANDANRFVGSANPAFSATLGGFVHGETLATSGVSGSAALSTSADLTTPVGTAAIVAKQGSLAAGNYDFASFKDGTLTVNAVYVPPSTPLVQTLPDLNPVASLTPSATTATSSASDSPSADAGSSSANTLPTGGSSTGNSGGSSNTMPTAVDVTRSSDGSFRVALPNPSQYGSQFAGGGIARPPVAYMANGAALPGWLKFNSNTLVFSGVQPPGVMTIKVRVVINGVPTDVTLNFKAPNK